MSASSLPWSLASTPWATSTVCWCIASKFKAPRNIYWMSNMFLRVEIFLFFVCYHVLPKRHSQLDYELNPRTGFLSREPDFQEFLKKPHNMFCWCFKAFFSVVRHLSREPDFWAQNHIFKNFLKSLKTCLIGVFWVFHVFFLALFDIWAENRIFEPRTVFSNFF